ncbi:exocyst complex component 3-like protein 4 [Astyanax mexicanus]|uniref:Exocyst complex component 3-like protein 4 n=1 Tax=Astyanax mexicanus TaxID=7994 RepID=A0A8T2M112_ASTMX|nr:exocyst complex component 3-like protein 4 [Astyanax mexicanus]
MFCIDRFFFNSAGQGKVKGSGAAGGDFRCFQVFALPGGHRKYDASRGSWRRVAGRMADNGRGESDGAYDVTDIPAWDEGPKSMEESGAMENSSTPTVFKDKMHQVRKSFKGSIRRMGEKSPLSLKNKGSTSKKMGNTPDLLAHTPPSPNLSIGSSSPHKSAGDPSQSPQVQKHQPSHSRTQSDSVIVFGDELPKKQGPGRWSFRLGSKKDKTGAQTSKQEQLEVLTENWAPTEEMKPEVTEEAVKVPISYTLPEIPVAPLSVMQINKLIEMEVLEEAYLNLLSLRKEFQHERTALGEEDSPVELAHKEKDLSLLYNALRTKLNAIVRQSCALPSRNKELLVHVACIIQEEEKREGDLGGMSGWRDAWRDAVKEGLKDTVKGVHLNSHEESASWLAVHLGLLGKAVVEDLEKVKTELVNSYPLSFNVFETYTLCCHEVVGEHLKRLLEKVTEMRDYHALLDFIIHRYTSEKIMGSISLQPELKEEQRTLKMDEDFMNKIKTGYCTRVQVEMKSSLDKVIELEHEEMWKDSNEPEIDEDSYNSHIHMDIWTNIKGKAQATRRLDMKLEQNVVRCCLEELKHFPKRFESAFVQWSSALTDSSLWAVYHITYINSFSALKEHMEGYRDTCPQQMEQLGKEVDGLVHRLSQTLLERFQTDAKPFLRRMLTRKWLSTDEDFQQLTTRIENLSKQCKHMSSQHAEALVSEVHYFVVKEYVSQLMKNNYSCKNRKNEKAASKMSEQWGELRELFQEMNSSQNWLYPVGDHLSKIVGQRNKSEIKNNLKQLVNDYPDISKKHLSAVLYFRGMSRGRERQVILQKLSELKRLHKISGKTEHALFTEIQPAVNTDCLANLPFSCFSMLLPDS